MAGPSENELRGRAGNACEYCRLPTSGHTTPFVSDHIIARQHGGRTIAGNLAFACFHCNTHKGPNIASIDPLTGKIVRLFHPRLHKWSAHFEWLGAELVGRTRIGRATIVALDINNDRRIALRESLMDEGLFFV
jgi:hypothetical protein